MNKDMTMNLTVSSPASPVPAAAPAGPALKWMWAAIGALGVSVLFLVLVGRFVYLQVLQHGHYDTLAESNRIAIAPVHIGHSRAASHADRNSAKSRLRA